MTGAGTDGHLLIQAAPLMMGTFFMKLEGLARN